MRLKKWYLRSAFVFICSLLAVCLLTSYHANALGITGGQVLHYQSGAMIGYPSTVVLGQMGKSAEVLWYNFGDVNQWYGFDLRTIEEIPANSLVSFNITYTMTNDSGPVGSLSYNGLQFEDGRTLLFDSCQDASRNFTNYTTWTCSYLYYNPYATYYIQTRGGNHIIEVPQSSSVSVVRNVVIGTPSAIRLTNDGLSASDRAWLESVLPDSTSIGQIEQGVTDALENQADAEREELEDAQDEAESTADDAGEQAETATQSLTQTIGNVIDVIKNTEATNCEITVNIPGMINIGTLNMCNMPQTYRDVINYVTSGVLILAILTTAYDIVLIYIDYIRSYQDGGNEKR